MRGIKFTSSDLNNQAFLFFCNRPHWTILHCIWHWTTRTASYSSRPDDQILTGVYKMKRVLPVLLSLLLIFCIDRACGWLACGADGRMFVYVAKTDTQPGNSHGLVVSKIYCSIKQLAVRLIMWMWLQCIRHNGYRHILVRVGLSTRFKIPVIFCSGSRFDHEPQAPAFDSYWFKKILILLNFKERYVIQVINKKKKWCGPCTHSCLGFSIRFRKALMLAHNQREIEENP